MGNQPKVKSLWGWIAAGLLALACQTISGVSAPVAASAIPPAARETQPAELFPGIEATPTARPLPPAPRTSTPSATPARIRQGPGQVDVPILLYHHVAIPEYNLSPYYVTPEHFEEQLKLLRDWGYETISMDLLTRAIHEGAALPPRPVVISFDDGQLDVYENAFPLMEQYGYTGILYLVGTYVDAQTFMTSAQIKEMVSAGWEIGSHSMSHADLTKLEPDQQIYEIFKSRELLNEKTGAPVLSFAYPFGFSSEGLAKKIWQAGYASAVGVGYNAYQSEWNLYLLQRRDVKGTMDLKAFAALLPWQGVLPTVSAP